MFEMSMDLKNEMMFKYFENNKCYFMPIDGQTHRSAPTVWFCCKNCVGVVPMCRPMFEMSMDLKNEMMFKYFENNKCYFMSIDRQTHWSAPTVWFCCKNCVGVVPMCRPMFEMSMDLKNEMMFKYFEIDNICPKIVLKSLYYFNKEIYYETTSSALFT